MNLKYIEIDSNNLDLAVEIQNNIFPLEDGRQNYIEGIEKGNIVGVQWHPEALHDIKLFRRFVEEFFDNKWKVCFRKLENN